MEAQDTTVNIDYFDCLDTETTSVSSVNEDKSNQDENFSAASCSHNWQGNIETGSIKCSICSETISRNAIKSKQGENLSSVEKAQIYWTLNHYMTVHTGEGKYLYSEDSAFSLTADEYSVTVEFLQKNIWGVYAYDDYDKYYNSTSSATNNLYLNKNENNFRTVSEDNENFWQALSAAQTLVKEALKTPTTAKFPKSGSEYSITCDGADYKVSGYVDAQNIYGAMLRQKWFASFTMHKAGGYNYEISNRYVEIYE